MKEKTIWEERDFYLVHHESTVPWLILHPKEEYREFSDIPRDLRCRIVDLLTAIEEEMLDYYRPDKINIASFGNHLPRQHWHIMARFKTDSHFPEPMWGERQRKGELNLPESAEFFRRLEKQLKSLARS